MTKLKLTDWYTKDQKPVRVGVYERDYGDYVSYCYWDGESFGPRTEEVIDAFWMYSGSGRSPNQGFSWRGVAK